MISRRTLLGATLASGASGLLPSIANAQESFTLKGKTVEWIIPFGEGGGNDAWARFFANYLEKYLPGEPNVIVRNVPGGGSITGTNSYAKRAPNDGLSLLGVSGSTQFPYLLGDKRVQYEYRDFTPVLVSPTGGVVYIPASFGVKDLSELPKLFEQELILANTGPTSLDLVVMLAFEMIGLKVRHVFGMGSRGETRIAFERGEATIDYQTSSSYLTNVIPLVEGGTAVPLFSLGALDENANIVRDPTFPDIPHFLEAYEIVHGKSPEPGPALDAYIAFFSAGFPAQKMALLHKTTPAEVVDAYRTAFAKAVADPELQARKADILGEYQQATGDAAERLFGIATTIDEGAKTWVQDYLRENYHVNL